MIGVRTQEDGWVALTRTESDPLSSHGTKITDGTPINFRYNFFLNLSSAKYSVLAKVKKKGIAPLKLR